MNSRLASQLHSVSPCCKSDPSRFQVEKNVEKHNNQFVFHLNNFLRYFCSDPRCCPVVATTSSASDRCCEVKSWSLRHCKSHVYPEMRLWIVRRTRRWRWGQNISGESFIRLLCIGKVSAFPRLFLSLGLFLDLVLSRVSFNVALLYYYLNKQYRFSQIREWVASWV